MLHLLTEQPIAAVLLIIALGTLLGSVRLANLSLGASGVLFVGLLFGYLGTTVPAALQDLGIVLFVYAIGLQAGPRFFNQFRHRGLTFAAAGIVVVGSGAVATWAVTRIFSLDSALATGMYAGAMTSTPGLAAALDVADNPISGVGYGIAYPFGVIGVVLFVQMLPRLIGLDVAKEEEILREAEPKGKQVQRRQFRVSNPACSEKTLAELEFHRLSEANVTRVSRNGEVMPAGPDTRLELGDVVLAVGRDEELSKLTVLLGEEIHGEDIFRTTDVVARDVMVSNDEVVGKSLTELRVLRNHGVVISRVFREDLHFVPTGTYVLETGDLIRVTGTRHDVRKFVALVGQREGRIYETSLPALATGLFLGVLLGFHEFSLPGGASFRLGIAGGPLLVSLILSHFGKVGSLRIRIPRAAKYIMRQLGLVLFLAGAGVEAGASLDFVLSESGLVLFVAGASVTLISVLVGFLFTRFCLKQDVLSSLGVVCGGMTSTPALGALSEVSSRNEPVLAYTGVYPVALVFITLVCKFLYYLL